MYTAKGVKYLSHSAKEIDEKIKRIPLATISETEWERTEDWEYIADQAYDPESGYAQSGKAVAEAIASLGEGLVTKDYVDSLLNITPEDIDEICHQVVQMASEVEF
jgi:hypothetical protein